MVKKQEKVRIDKYLWSIRIFKTRSLATVACEKGKIKWNGNTVKASKIVTINDEYEIKTEARLWIIKVVSILQQRVQFSEAISYYLDLTPQEDLIKTQNNSAAFFTGKRLSKTGRPTKKQRRNLDDLNL